jgi:hypothetical protein
MNIIKQEIVIVQFGNDLMLMFLPSICQCLFGPLLFRSKKQFLIQTKTIKHGITNKIVHAQLIKTLGRSNLDASTKTSGLACILGSILTLWAFSICPTRLLILSSILLSEVFCARTRPRLNPWAPNRLLKIAYPRNDRGLHDKASDIVLDAIKPISIQKKTMVRPYVPLS